MAGFALPKNREIPDSTYMRIFLQIIILILISMQRTLCTDPT